MDDPLSIAYLKLRSQEPNGEDGYYQVTLLASDDGELMQSVQTWWCGYTETKPRREIRNGRLYHPAPQKEWLERFDQPCVVVNDENDLHIFFLWGGVGLIEKSVADKHVPDLVGPRECMRDSSHFGFVGVSNLPKSKTQHAPSKKLRLSVIRRDEFRCRVCGRSPSNYVDVELHVHHIIPWGIGGMTEEKNLITICKTCHDGIDPHYLPTLSTLQKGHKNEIDEEEYNKAVYINGIKNYQLAMKRYFEKGL